MSCLYFYDLYLYHLFKQMQSSPSDKSKSVLGLRVEGPDLTVEQVTMDSSFVKCPIAHAAGIPLYVKKLSIPSTRKHTHYRICRMMSEPSQGIAPMEWQYGGSLPPAPIVLVARSDWIQFDQSDWQVLDDFEMAMLDDGPRKVTRKHFIKFVKKGYSEHTANIVLEVMYPKGAKCVVNGLVKKTELNGRIGICNGVYEDERIGMQFEGLQGKYGLKPSNVQIQ